MATVQEKIELMKEKKAYNLKTTLKVVIFLRNSSLASRRVSSLLWLMVASLAMRFSH